MNLTYEDHGTRGVVAPKGSLTKEHVDAFRRGCEERLEAGVLDIVLDFSALDLADSTGLEALLDLQEKLAEHGGRLRLAGAGTAMRSILAVTRLDGRFEMHDSVESAARSLR